MRNTSYITGETYIEVKLENVFILHPWLGVFSENLLGKEDRELTKPHWKGKGRQSTLR